MAFFKKLRKKVKKYFIIKLLISLLGFSLIWLWVGSFKEILNTYFSTLQVFIGTTVLIVTLASYFGYKMIKLK